MSAFNVHVGTTADLTGVKQTIAGINQIKAAQQRAEAGALAGQVKGAVAGQIGIPTSFAGAILGAIAAIGGLVHGAIEMATVTKDLSEQLDLTTGEVQALGKAARTTGLEFNDFGVAISQLGAARRGAAEGNDELVEKFKRFGVTLADLNNPALRNIDLLNRMAAASGNLSAADRVALKDLLGRKGDRLAAALAELPGIQKEGLVSDEAIANIDEAEKAFGSMWKSAKTGTAEFIGGFIQALKELRRELLGLPKVAPASAKPDQEADRVAWMNDKGRVERKEITAEQASPGYRRKEAFDAAQAKNRGVELVESQRAEEAQNAGLGLATKREDLKAQRDELIQKRAGLPAGSEQNKLNRAIDALDAQIATVRVAEDKKFAEADKHSQASSAAGKASRVDYQNFQFPTEGQGDLFKNKKADDARLANASKVRDLELSLMTADERRTALAERRKQLAAEIAGMDEGEAKEKKKGELIDVAKQGIEAEKAPAFTTPVDQLQRIGGFLGGTAFDPVKNEMAKGNVILGEVKTIVAGVKQALDNGPTVKFQDP